MTELVPLPTGADLIKFLGWSSSARNLDMCNTHVQYVAALAKAHTRGKGFSMTNLQETVAEPIAQVILSGAARSVSNPSAVFRIEAGTTVATPGRFENWNLAEQVTLNRFRTRII